MDVCCVEGHQRTRLQLLGDSSLSDLSLHRRLERQLKDSLGKTTDFDGPVQALVDQVNAVYKQADEDRAMLERSLKSSSQDLMQANHEMRAILKAIPDLVLTLDEDHLVTHYKRGIGTFPFIIEDHPQGKPFHRIVKSTSRERFEEFLEQVERTGHPNEFEFIDYGSSNDHYFEARVIPVEAKRTMVLVRHPDLLSGGWDEVPPRPVGRPAPPHPAARHG